MFNATKFYSTKYKRFLNDLKYLKFFPSTFKILQNENITKKTAGNSMSINVLMFLLKDLLIYLKIIFK